MDVCVRDAVANSGERTRLACWFRRHAETILLFSRSTGRIDDLKGKFAIAGRARQHARRVRSPDYANAREAIRRVVGRIVRARIRG
jgi:hypothetical protein